jgi:beta-lactamase regulating signal transducer with metallopeptidase domain/5-hydroxyisourate hydrolase-like protein (transthyretin family)
MKSTDALRGCLTLFSSHPLLERLFFASIEFAVLAVLVFGVIRVGRIRSARLASLLWLLVLAKPLVSLAIGSPLPLVRMEVAPAVIAAPTPVEAAAHVDPQTSVARPMAGEAQASRLSADDLDDTAATGLAQPAPETTSAEITNTVTTPPIDSAAAPPVPSVSSSRPWNPAAIVLTIWLTGTACFAGLSLLDRVRVLRLVRGAQLPEASLSARYHAVASQLGLKRPVRLRITTALEGPALVGSVFPTILIPAWLADDSNHARLDWALRHELMHWKLLDPFASLVRELAQILFYFHPAAWWAGRQWEISAERACDRAIVTNDLDSHDYAEQLYGILVGMQGRLRARIGNGLFATRTQIGQRIAALLNGPRTPHPHLSALALVIVTLVAAVTLSIGGAFADKHLKGHDSEKPDDSQNTTAVAQAEKPAEKPAEPSPAVVPPPSASVASTSRPSVAEPKPANTSDAAFTYAGTVVDDHGKPVAGAKLALDYWRASFPPGDIPSLAVSDAQGRFQFSRRQSDFSDAGSWGPWWLSAMLVATKEGYGLAGARSIPFETTGKLAAEQRQQPRAVPAKGTNILKLVPDDVPIHGRILDAQGRPVSGALVQTINVWEGRDGSLDAWETAAQEPQAVDWHLIEKLRALDYSYAFAPRPALVPAVRTDTTGWFTLKGIGRERIADVAVSGAGIETMLLHVRSRRGTVIKLPSSYRIRDPRIDSYYPCEFTHVVGPSVPVEGHVTDAKSKGPLARIIVRADRIGGDPLTGAYPARLISTTTAADGSYRLQGLPLGLNRLGVVPPIGSRYLRAGLDVTTRRGDTRLVADIPLTAGILVRGRVTDSRTGMRVPGSVEYFASLTNPHLHDAPGFEKNETSFGAVFHYRTNENGVFEIPVLPGKGVLAFRADDFRAFPQGVGADRIDGPQQQTPWSAAFIAAPTYSLYHLLTPLDPQPGAGVMTLGLTLRSGVTVKGKVLAADGKPLSDYCILGETRFMSWSRNQGETFAVEGYEPTEHRRLMFYHPGRNLVGLYDLTGEPPAELEIKLHPGATIAGRIVDAGGRPLENMSIADSPLQTISPDTISPDNRAEERQRGVLLSKYLQEQIQGQRFATDKQGRFKLRGIIPGLRYSGTIFYTGGPWGGYPVSMFTDVTAKEGETKDLGDLPFKPPGPHAAAEPPKAKTENADVNVIHGRVLLPDGKPASGATVLALRRVQAAVLHRGPLAKTTAGPNGEFTLRVPKSQADDRHGEMGPLCIAAAANAFGAQWRHWDRFRDTSTEIVLKLVTESSIHGRIVDREGKPVRGARVKLLWQDLPNEDLSVWLDHFKTLDSSTIPQIGRAFRQIGHGDEMPACDDESRPPMLTDQDGRFTLRGVGADRVARLELRGEAIAYAELDVTTRDIQPVTRKDGSGAAGRLFGTDFTYQVAPTRPIVGSVLDAASGAPLAGVGIESRSIAGIANARQGVVRTTTDAQGKYRLIGMPTVNWLEQDEKSAIAVVFKEEQPYFQSNRVNVPRTPGVGPVTLNFRLTRGLWITGRVTDRATGKPIHASLVYSPFLSNPLVKNLPGFDPQVLADAAHDTRSLSGADGTYRLVGLPGRGLVSARSLGGSYRIGVGASEIEGMSPLGTAPTYFANLSAGSNAMKEINPTPGTESVTCDFAFDVGATVRLSLVDSAGKPAGPCRFRFSRAPRNSVESRSLDSTIKLNGLSPNESRPLLIEQPERQIGKVLLFHYDEKAPRTMTVTLEPCATIKGRFLGEDDVPLKLERLSARAHLGDGSALFAARGETDAQGRFVLHGLPPGCEYYTIGTIGRGPDPRSATIVEKVVIAAGRTIDLGEIKVKRDGATVSMSNSDVAPKPAAAPAKPAVADVNVIHGRVLLPDGKPAAGARVLALRGFWNRHDKRTPLAKTTAGPDGKFAIRFLSPTYDGIGTAGAAAMIAAEANGFGVQWHWWTARFDKSAEVVLKLLPELPIHGRIVDRAGKPVRDARVTLVRQQTPNQGFGAWLEGARSGSPASDRLAMGQELQAYDDESKPPIITDHDGRFTLRGVGTERVAHLAVQGETIAYTEIEVVTQAIKPFGRKAPEGMVEVSGADFTCQAIPTRPIVGTVRDADTGAALAGVSIESRHIAGVLGSFPLDGAVRTETDAEGKYRLIGMPEQEGRGRHRGSTIAVVPRQDQPYLRMNDVEVPESPGLAPVLLDFKLVRGVWITGRVTDKATGAPALSQVLYVPMLANPLMDKLPKKQFDGNAGLLRSITRPDGTFRLVGLPGRGVVAAWAFGKIYRPHVGAAHSAGMAKNSGYPEYLAWRYTSVNALQEINPAQGTESVTCDLVVDPGGIVRISVVDRTGKPVSPCYFCYDMVARGGLMTSIALESPFDLRGMVPNESRPMMIVQGQRHLGKILIVHYDEKAPRALTVTLEPCATVKGRLIDAEGVPFKNMEVSAVARGGEKYWLNSGDAYCDSDGRFVFDKVVPGAEYYTINAREFGQVAERVVVAAGKTIDLGDIKLKRRK